MSLSPGSSGRLDEDTAAGVDAGAEWILWGSPSGLIGTDSVSRNEGTSGDEGPGAGHRYGASMAVSRSPGGSMPAPLVSPYAVAPGATRSRSVGSASSTPCSV